MIDTDGAPVCAQKNLVVAGSTNDTEVDEVLLNCANEFSFLVKYNDLATLPKNDEIACQVSHDALLDGLFYKDLID